jgi:endonuclease/exonuclease/phosphatase family metal-dependent hydrolase
LSRNNNLILFLFIISTELSYAQVDTIRIATYSILNFPCSKHEIRAPYFRIVIHTFDPDILVVQEIDTLEDTQHFLKNILNYYCANEFASAPFINGKYSDNALFYKPDKVALVSNRQINTSLRDISEYVLSSNKIVYSQLFKVYSLHLKASSGTKNKHKRLLEATTLRNILNKLPANTHFFVCGDFNIYSHKEPAWDVLTGYQVDNDGRCFDPINTSGKWHNNLAFKTIHTQSTRTIQINKGASGGLDDRFDMILISDKVRQVSTYTYLKGSYTTFGNDGNHFNGNINDGINSAVPDIVADALYYASDHLPVFLDFTVSANH